MKSEEDFVKIIKSQVTNALQDPNRTYLLYLYSLIQNEINSLTSETKTLEVGAASGISSKFLSLDTIVRTDLLFWDDPITAVLGGIDCEKLPFKDNEFKALFAIDTLHHLSDPILGLTEMVRVVEKGGKLIFIEPYVSMFSYPFYKIFHHEKTTMRINHFDLNQKVSQLAGDGDQGIPKAMFKSSTWELIKPKLKREITLEINFLSPFSFFATGGLTKPLPIPGRLIALLISMERKIPKVFLKLLGSRMFITMTIS
jgi:SAM-dependent methyltransferase